MNNALASAVTIYTPRYPVSASVASEIKAMASESLLSLSKSIDEFVSANSVEGSGEEEVIIITAPPPR